MDMKAEIARISTITDCTICKSSYKNPKILTCGHTFCLKCIERGAGCNTTAATTTTGSKSDRAECTNAERDETVGTGRIQKSGGKGISGRNKLKMDERMPCPTCRRMFLIPSGGLRKLPQNVFVENMVAVTKISQSVSMSSKTIKNMVCEFCKETGHLNKLNEVKKTSQSHKTVTVTQTSQTSTFHCAECRKWVCSNCSSKHNKLHTSLHLAPCVVAPPAQITMEELMRHRPNNYCLKHTTVSVSQYCFNCCEVICMVCFAESHHDHRCKEISKAADEFRPRLEHDIHAVNELARAREQTKLQFSAGKKEFSEDVRAVELTITRRREELIEMIDTHYEQLLGKLRDINVDNLEKLDAVEDAVTRQQAELDSFVVYVTQLKNHGTPADVLEQFRDLHERSAALAAMKITAKGDISENVQFPIELGFSEYNLKETLERPGKMPGCVNVLGKIEFTIRHSSSVHL